MQLKEHSISSLISNYDISPVTTSIKYGVFKLGIQINGI